MRSLLPILPPLLALTGALLAFLAGEDRRRLAAVAAGVQIALLSLCTALLFAVEETTILFHALGGWNAPVGIVFVADRASTLLALVLVAVFTAALLYTFLDEEPSSRSRVLALLFLLEMGVTGALFTGDAFDFYVFFELMSLSAFGLVGYRRSPAHVEAALKFAALSLAGSTLMLMGVGAIYAQTGALTFASLPTLSAQVLSPPLYLLAIGLVLTALCLKCAVVPLHFWLPDAHSIAPTGVSVVLSGALVKVGAWGILRFLGSQAPWVWADVRGALLAAGAATALLAALAAVAQRDLKRLLAYSTASQMGYVVAAAALGTAAGVSAALVHAGAHGLTKSTLFLGAGAAMTATGERRWDRMGGLLRLSPLFAAAMLVAMLSLAGIPPLVGFAGKLVVFRALLGEGAWAPLVCLVGASALMLYLMARLWLGIFGGAPRPGIAGPPTGKVAITCAAAALVALAGIGAGPLVGAATAAAADLLHPDRYRAAILAPALPEVAP